MRMLQRLALHCLHERLGACFISVGEWELPGHYSGALEEYRAARGVAVLADVSHLGKLCFQGKDVRKFLNGLLSNDIQNLRPGQGLPTCLLASSGKLVADFWLYDLEEFFLAIGTPQTTPGIVNALSKYLTLSQTRLEDRSDRWTAFYLMGPGALRVCREILEPALNLSPRECAAVSWKGRQLLVLSYPVFSPDGLLVLAPLDFASEVWEALMRSGGSLLRPMGFEAWEMLRVESGVPLWGVDMDGDTFPQEANLSDHLSVTKGCYLGQEIMARIRNFGRLHHKLMGLKLSREVSAGAQIRSGGHGVGRLTSVAFSPPLSSPLALAMLPVSETRPGTSLEVVSACGTQTAEVLLLPLRPS